MGMLASKTVVYVTHQIEFLPAADIILVRHFHPRFTFYEYTSNRSRVICWPVKSLEK